MFYYLFFLVFLLHVFFVVSFFMQSSSGSYFSPFGVEQSLHEVIGKLEECYGEKKGKKFRIWVDQVFPSQLDSNTWLVKFKKLEQSGVSSLSWILHFYTQKIKMKHHHGFLFFFCKL